MKKAKKLLLSIQFLLILGSFFTAAAQPDPILLAGEQAIFFKKPNGWGNDINTYIYYHNEHGHLVRITKEWVGDAMEHLGNDVYKYSFSGIINDDWGVLFNDGWERNQVPLATNGGHGGYDGFDVFNGGYYDAHGLNHIVKQTILPENIIITNSSTTYNGLGQSPTVTITPNVSYSIKYKPEGAAITAFTTDKPVNAGNYDILITVTQDGYTGIKTGTFTIKKRSIEVSINALSKTYDGTTTVATFDMSSFLISGKVGTDDLFVSNYSSASYDNKNAGTGKTITITGIMYGGNDKENYMLPQTITNSTSKIEKKALTITVDAGQSKVYDKNPNNPTAYTYTHTSLAPGDLFTGALTRTKGENSGTYEIKIGTLTPTTPTNYHITFNNSTFEIKKKELTITGASAINKVYNATTTAQIVGGSLNGIITDDAVSFTVVGNFDDKNVGSSKPITAQFSLTGGTVVNNYMLTQPSGFTADITPKALEIVGFSIKDRTPTVGNFTAEIDSWGTLQTIPAADIGKVTVKKEGVTATFPSDGAGTYYVALSTLELEGVEKDNYTLSQPSGDALKATISTDVPIFNWTAQNLETTYNGLPYPIVVTEEHNNTTALVEYDHGDGNGWVANEPIDAGSYSVRATSTDLTYVGEQKRSLTIHTKILPAATFGTGTKTYDNTVNVVTQPTLILEGIETRDIATVTASGDDAKYDDENVGNNKSVTITNIVLNGAGATNYTIPNTATNSTWSITKLDYTTVPLTFSFSEQTKVFDGTTSVKKDGVETIPTITITGFLSGDSFTATAASAFYDTPNAGTGKTVTLANITYSNNATDNYELPTLLTNNNCEIVQLSLEDITNAEVTILPQTKVYDGTTDVKDNSGANYVPPISISGLLTGFDDVAAIGATANYSDKNVGNNKTVTIEGITYSGSDVANYTLPTKVENNQSAITPLNVNDLAGLEVTFSPQTKTYDGTTAVKDETGKRYTPALIINGLITGDDVAAIGAIANYSDKNVGNNKTVTIEEITYSGSDVANYTLPTKVENNQSAITPLNVDDLAGLEVAFSPQTKTYDGTTAVKDETGKRYTPALIINGLITGDDVAAIGTTANYSDKNVGNNKTVTIEGITYSGSDVSNYTLPKKVSKEANAITTKPIEIRPLKNQEKIFNDEEIQLDFSVSPVYLDNSLVIEDELIGELSWNNQRQLGSYEILQGTMTNNYNPNYDITFVKGIHFTIVSNIHLIRKWGYMLLVDNKDDAIKSYQWYKDGVALTDETNQYYADKSKTLCGIYSCEIVMKDGTKLMLPNYEFTENCASTKSISLYPNPVKSESQFYLVNQNFSTQSPKLTEYMVKVFNIHGQLIETKNVSILNKAILNAPTTKGIYFIHVLSENKEINVFKILVTE